MRKPYKTTEQRRKGRNPLIRERLGKIELGVLSGGKTRKQIYLETIPGASADADKPRR